MKRSWKGVFLSLGLALSAATAFAQEEVPQKEAPDTTLSPYVFVEDGDPAVDRLPLKETKVGVHVAGVIADVVVTQVYQNEGSRPLNARYVFPASTRAAVHGMTLRVGERRVRARIRERRQAQAEFKAAVAAGKSAALLEQERPNVFGMSVGNVMPGDEIRVELHYSELLVPTDGTYEFVYPTVVGPRYGKGKTAAPSQPRTAVPATDFSIETTLDAGMPIGEVTCPSHETHVEWRSLSSARITLDPGEARKGNRDYVLRYRLQGRQVATGLLLYPGQDESFFLLMVQPPDRVAPRQIPPREYVFVLDVSGSMEGFPLYTAKILLRELSC